MTGAPKLRLSARREAEPCLYKIAHPIDQSNRPTKLIALPSIALLARSKASSSNAPNDQIVIIPFNATARPDARGTGTAADQAHLLDFVMKQQTRGDSDFYGCAEQSRKAGRQSNAGR